MKSSIICTTLLIESSPQALPLGAACIASYLKTSKALTDKYDILLKAISMEDPSYLKGGIDYFYNSIISNTNIKYVLFSVYVWNRKALEEVALLLKSHNIITIAGGPEVTANPLSFTSFDYTISGSGEVSALKLIETLEKGSPVEIPGVYPKDFKGAMCRSLSPDPASLPSPYLDGTINLKDYGGALWELARGCPFKCSYCYESKGEKRIQYFPLERISKELDLFNKEGISQVFVLDPTYNASKKRALELLDLISKKAPGIFFYFEARAEFIDRPLAKAFTKIPCALQFGLQSSDPEVLKLVNRSLDRKLFSKNISYLNEEGVIFGFDLIYGLPGDTLEGFRKSVDYALSLYPNNLETFCLSVLPGTDLEESASRLNLVYEKTAPYRVLKTDRFTVEDLSKCASISHACNVFYNQGRAVPFFNSLVYLFHTRAVNLLEDFSKWYKSNKQSTLGSLAELDSKALPHKDLEVLQLEFLKDYASRRNLKGPVLDVIDAVVRLNGALSRVTDLGKDEVIQIKYHPDDIMSQYSQDIRYFSQACPKMPSKVRIFKGKNGVDFKVIK